MVLLRSSFITLGFSQLNFGYFGYLDYLDFSAPGSAREISLNFAQDLRRNLA